MSNPSTKTEIIRETELKLKPSQEVQAKLSSVHSPGQIIQVLKGAFDLGDYEFGDEKYLDIVDQYYDTSDFAFFSSHATLRVRKKGESIELTLKTPRAHRPGVSDRIEHTKKVTVQEIEFYEKEGFVSFFSEIGKKEYSKSRIQHVLTISNTRRLYELKRLNSNEVLELCLDTFHCTKPDAKSNRRASFEIEIEAKTPEAIERLERIKTNLGLIVPTLTTEDKSKYQQAVESLALNRGYFAKRIVDAYGSTVLVTWISVVLGIVSIVLTIIFFALSK